MFGVHAILTHSGGAFSRHNMYIYVVGELVAEGKKLWTYGHKDQEGFTGTGGGMRRRRRRKTPRTAVHFPLSPFSLIETR